MAEVILHNEICIRFSKSVKIKLFIVLTYIYPNKFEIGCYNLKKIYDLSIPVGLWHLGVNEARLRSRA